MRGTMEDWMEHRTAVMVELYNTRKQRDNLLITNRILMDCLRDALIDCEFSMEPKLHARLTEMLARSARCA